MTSDEIKTIESIAFALADGAKVIFPVAAPMISIIEDLVSAANLAGVVPTMISKEEQSAIAAGIAAGQASAVTSVKAHSNAAK